MVVIGNALDIFQDGTTATEVVACVAPLLVPLLLAEPESCIPVVVLSSFHQLTGLKDIMLLKRI